MHLNLKGKLVSLDSPLVMGIVNYTEDSFYDGGRYFSEDKLMEKIKQQVLEGADIIDIGAVSTRPGAADISEQEECDRIGHLLAILNAHFPDVLVSVDTWRAAVAEMAVCNGAAMINDVSGGTFDDRMIPAIGKLKVPYCLMHTPAKPDVMQQEQHTAYDSMISDIIRFFGEQLAKLKAVGVNDVILDPGFGFGKTLEQNYLLMKNLSAFADFHLPLLVGVSRKSMIYNQLKTNPDGALTGTIALHAIALLNGANILRVHDVKAARETVAIVEAVK
ncbi:dihydropteroate synthase [Bacteroidales bacterium OttesenSCG-928-B11]|nr:dihydropteroate synthase [Bacteroidales bacterium OttesenSCG-928-B11]MDL2326988.1 dihydropteroate synthase [Bacteroidales bacterium OttesenSCG-928-A14]